MITPHRAGQAIDSQPAAMRGADEGVGTTPRRIADGGVGATAGRGDEQAGQTSGSR